MLKVARSTYAVCVGKVASTCKGGKAQEQACAKITAEQDVIAITQQRGVLAHKGGEGGEASAEARHQHKPHRRREPTALGVPSRQQANEETAHDVHRERAQRRGRAEEGFHGL